MFSAAFGAGFANMCKECIKMIKKAKNRCVFSCQYILIMLKYIIDLVHICTNSKMRNRRINLE